MYITRLNECINPLIYYTNVYNNTWYNVLILCKLFICFFV